MNKTLTLEEILEIVDKHGFDWFGSKSNPLFAKWNIRAGKIRLGYTDNNSYGDYSDYSLADLACNKSFLKALERYYYKNVSTSDFDDYDTSFVSDCIVDDLIYNDGKNFCQIVTDFIGGV